MMSILFEPIKIRNMEVPNRFVRSATYDAAADRNGHVSDQQMKLYTDLAEGGVGLIVTGITSVHPSGRTRVFQNVIDDDDSIHGFRRLTTAVHERGAKIAVQLHHGGRDAAGFFKENGEKAIAPSVVPNDPYFNEEYREMTEDEIRQLIRAFGTAAHRARDAGFDSVQLHGAHAFLFSQFLSPFTNRRIDRWGGSLENRLRFHQEVYGEIRKKVGEDYPILIKVGVQDGFSGGLEFSEGKRAARLLDQCGYDALEISQGLRGKGWEETEFRTDINTVDREGFFREWCREITSCVKAPTMMMGGLRSFEFMEEVVQKGEAAFVSFSRPFIREPGIVNDWKRGDRHRARCISCNKCLTIVRSGEAVRCGVEKATKDF
jgi:2,4-dienoyl-CoA reductase-like NADH-dependent reductase (Old Yellow Enzyme family)